jgi:Trypsin-co-occurring domain 1
MNDINDTRVVIFSSDSKGKHDFDLLGDSPGGVTTVGALRRNLAEFMPGLGAIIADVKAKAENMGLNEISVELGVNAKGTVGFLGTGAELGGNSTLTLKFKIG